MLDSSSTLPVLYTHRCTGYSSHGRLLCSSIPTTNVLRFLACFSLRRTLTITVIPVAVMAGGRISGGSLDATVLRAAVTGHPEYVQYKTHPVCKPYSVSCLFLPRTRRSTRTDVVTPPPLFQRASARDNCCLRSERHHQRTKSRSPIAVRPCMPFPSSGQCN